MQLNAQDTVSLEQLKLFAAIFLDGELNGGPLRGLCLAAVSDNMIHFLNSLKYDTNYKDKYHLSLESINEIASHLTQISDIEKFLQSNTVHISAKYIFDIFDRDQNVFFPGGWIASPAGHAMIYRLFQDQDKNVIFLSFNTGEGAQYHKKIAPSHLSTIKAEDYKEKFNPVYAIRFNDHEKIKEYGGLQAWIKKLVEPNMLPRHDSTYIDNNAEGIYRKIFSTSAYLGGEVVDPAPYFAHSTSGQRSGTCAQQVTQKMLRSFFITDTDYDRFIFDYSFYVLQDFLINKKIPQTYKKEFHAAVANTARMITTGKELEQKLVLDDKKIVVEQLTELKNLSNSYFNTITQEEPFKKIEIFDTTMRVTPLDWMPKTIPQANKLPKKINKTPILLFDKTGSFIDAIKSLDRESQQLDKRLFVHNIEQLCFTFCDQFKDFRNHPFPQENTKENWEQAIILLHKYSIEYFDFYFKNKSDCKKISYLFNMTDYGPGEKEKRGSSTGWLCASPRNQIIALGFMCLMHYSALMYHARIFGYSKWQSELNNIDRYVAYMPSWLLSHKMPRDFYLSSTDPDMSNLFFSLTCYYKDQKNASIEPDARHAFGTQLLDHYKTIMNTPSIQAEKQ